MRDWRKRNFDKFKQIIPRKMFFEIDLYGDKVSLNIENDATPVKF